MTNAPIYTGAVPGFGPEVPDETLVKTVLAGDRDAYGELYRRHASTVAGYLARRTPPGAPLEDLVQEAFAQALEQLGDFAESKFTFGQWLCGIAARVLFKYTKRWWTARQAEEASTDALGRELRDGPARPAVAVALSEELAAKVAALRPHYRRVVELCYLEGQSHEGTAEAMGIPVALVNKYLFRARAELRNPAKRKHYAPDKRARLIEAARQVAAEVGVEGATGAVIAERAGVHRALINRYFGSPAALLALATGRPVEAKRRGTALRDHILGVARQVVAEVGTEQASVALITSRADVNKSSIFRRFGSLAALLALATGETGQVAA